MLPSVTTVIPTYRRPKLLRRAILSAVEQVGACIKVRVCDNASGDETAEVVASLVQLYPQIEYHCHPRNIGAAANFEFGVSNLDTPFFSLMSDDDYLLPGFYQRALSGLDEHPEAVFWAGMTLNVDPAGTIWDVRVSRWQRYGVFRPPEGTLALTAGRAPLWTGILFRREILQKAGFIDPAALGVADLDFILRVASRHPYVIEPIPVASFTLNPTAFSATEPMSSFWPGWRRMFQNVGRLDSLTLSDRGRLLLALQADGERMLFRRGINALARGRHDFARDAAHALANDCSEHAHAMLLRSAAFSCERVPGVQPVLTWAYRLLERQYVRSRRKFQDRFGHLLRPESTMR